jgi:uncharacterized membrane protein YfcA
VLLKEGEYMEDINLYTLLFLVLAGFIAAFIDSVVGGGGLISIPALLFTGISPSAALATNKLAGTMGSLTSTISFIRAGKVDFKFVIKLFPITVIGAALGAYVVHFVSAEILKPLILILLVIVAFYTLVKKDWGKDAKYKGLTRKKMILLLVIIFAIGFYDGFLGPGTGSFLFFSYFLMECSANEFLLRWPGIQGEFSAIFKQGHSLLQVFGNQLPRRFAVRYYCCPSKIK